jgi:hypothetical protein
VAQVSARLRYGIVLNLKTLGAFYLNSVDSVRDLADKLLAYYRIMFSSAQRNGWSSGGIHREARSLLGFLLFHAV